MEGIEHLVLKRAAFADIEFEFFAFCRAQTGIDKEAKRARRESFQTADGSSERFAIQRFDDTR